MSRAPEPGEDWSWHDDLIYGLHLRSADPDRELWRSELVLDIDHIVEWLRPEAGVIKWRIAPATLVFQDVSALRVAVDFSSDPLGNSVTEWSIHVIERTALPRREGYRGEPEYRWRIVLNVPDGGEIAFVASRFTLTLRAEAQIDADPAQRPPLVLPS